MWRYRGLLLLLLTATAIAPLLLLWSGWRVSSSPSPGQGEALTSASCRECHEPFYRLWSTSLHGLAMRPAGPDFVNKHLSPGSPDIKIGDSRYRVEIKGSKAELLEHGPRAERRYSISYALGGKNVLYFLTALDRGRLQVLPLALNARTKSWLDTTESMTRHFPAGAPADAPLHWTDRLLTFNTACFSCHVSQVSKNYHPDSDSYSTTWTEPGINCETCHGPGGEHVRVTKEKNFPPDLKIISVKQFTVEEKNHACASCHAKAAPITTSFLPKDKFFDHFDLVALEHPDFYPDGRDLGENYTMTGWLMSACVTSGRLDCLKCHTSSGRYRFNEEASANQACSPCHDDKVKDPAPHTHHKAAGNGSRCVHCHMPKTEFALMQRSDHSMRPPYPAATIAFGSPNACNICHADRSANWADRQVRQWHARDYQASLLRRGRLVSAARKGDWSRLADMLAFIRSSDRDEIFAASLIRLMADCPDERKWPTLRAALQDPSPLIRSAAADQLYSDLTAPETRDALFQATRDSCRLVRVRAAGSLAAYPLDLAPAGVKPAAEAALGELESSLQARPDDWSLNYNLGNFYLDRNLPEKARTAFEQATRLRPDIVMAWVNLSIASCRLGLTAPAEDALHRALQIHPESAPVKFNLALLRAETGHPGEAERLLREALLTDPQMAEAAYNLAVLLGNRGDVVEALKRCRQAASLRPEEPRYSHSLAFYLNQGGQPREAIQVLRRLIQRHPDFVDAYLLLGEIYETRGQVSSARQIYAEAARRPNLVPEHKALLENKLSP
ncbi:MAG: ammonia-forming cytochrome c nitrite reductase subunit c552 [Acidobacteria bacterium]|nr:MAG: ammonia-forming cytochrome c nitrite reductase subunit c552 [Acidobacteriota bacterium]